MRRREREVRTPRAGGGGLTGAAGPDHEGRRVIVKLLDIEGPSVFVAGVSTVSGKGRQFTTWRFREE